MSIKKHIPNLLTCGNLVCGCLAIVSAFNGNLILSAYLVGTAAILDFFDGFCARLLKVGGEMGKQLDSLADMVTFGVVPGVMLYQLMIPALVTLAGHYSDNPFVSNHLHYASYLGFVITIFSCVRLAKFNIDTRQTHSFIGVPTPANTLLICSLPLILHFQPVFFNMAIAGLISNFYFLIILTFGMSYLLIAEIPLFAMKFKNFDWQDNKTRYSFLILSVILLILFQFIAIPFIIFLYIILSVINNRNTKHINN